MNDLDTKVARIMGYSKEEIDLLYDSDGFQPSSNTGHAFDLINELGISCRRFGDDWRVNLNGVEHQHRSLAEAACLVTLKAFPDVDDT